MGLATADRFALRLGRLGRESLTQFSPLRFACQRIDHERVGRLLAACGESGNAALEIVWKLQTGCGHRPSSSPEGSQNALPPDREFNFACGLREAARLDGRPHLGYASSLNSNGSRRALR